MGQCKTCTTNTLHALAGAFIPGVSMPNCDLIRPVKGSVQAAAAIFKMLLWGGIFAALTYTLLRPGYLKSLNSVKLTSLANSIAAKADLCTNIAIGTGIFGGAAVVVSAIGGLSYTTSACKKPKEQTPPPQPGEVVTGIIVLLREDDSTREYILNNYSNDGTKNDANENADMLPIFTKANNETRNVIRLDRVIINSQSITGDFFIDPPANNEGERSVSVIVTYRASQETPPEDICNKLNSSAPPSTKNNDYFCPWCR